MATYSSILTWKVPWTEEPSGLYSPWGHKELVITEQLSMHSHTVGDVEHLLMCFCWPLEYLWRNVCSSPLPILN